MFELALVVGAVEIALRLCDEAVRRKLPKLESAEANAAAGSARASVGTDEGPMVSSAIALNDEVIHQQLQIGKRRYESLRHLSDGLPSNGRSAAVDSDGAVRREERCHARGIAAAPRRSVPLREITHIRWYCHGISPG